MYRTPACIKFRFFEIVKLKVYSKEEMIQKSCNKRSNLRLQSPLKHKLLYGTLHIQLKIYMLIFKISKCFIIVCKKPQLSVSGCFDLYHYLFGNYRCRCKGQSLILPWLSIKI